MRTRIGDSLSMFFASTSATSFAGSGRAAFSLIGRTLSVLQPDSGTATQIAAHANSVRTSGLRFNANSPKTAAVNGNPRAEMQNRYPLGGESARARLKTQTLIEHS